MSLGMSKRLGVMALPPEYACTGGLRQGEGLRRMFETQENAPLPKIVQFSCAELSNKGW